MNFPITYGLSKNLSCYLGATGRVKYNRRLCFLVWLILQLSYKLYAVTIPF